MSEVSITLGPAKGTLGDWHKLEQATDDFQDVLLSLEGTRGSGTSDAWRLVDRRRAEEGDYRGTGTMQDASERLVELVASWVRRLTSQMTDPAYLPMVFDALMLDDLLGEDDRSAHMDWPDMYRLLYHLEMDTRLMLNLKRKDQPECHRLVIDKSERALSIARMLDVFANRIGDSRQKPVAL